jgi:hypothetical protein
MNDIKIGDEVWIYLNEYHEVKRGFIANIYSKDCVVDVENCNSRAKIFEEIYDTEQEACEGLIKYIKTKIESYESRIKNCKDDIKLLENRSDYLIKEGAKNE